MKISDFGISDLNEKGVDCIIYDPLTFESTDIKITVYGMQSKAFKIGRREAAKAKAKVGSANDDFISHFIVASMIKSWENVEDNDGQIEFSLDNAIQLFNDAPFIFAQLERFIDDSSNFFLRK